MSIPQLAQFLNEEQLDAIYPNVQIALRIFLCTLASNCSAERSFSCLRRIKTYLRSSLCQERLNILAILAIESDLTKSLDYDAIIDKFADLKSRARPLWNHYDYNCVSLLKTLWLCFDSILHFVRMKIQIVLIKLIVFTYTYHGWRMGWGCQDPGGRQPGVSLGAALTENTALVIFVRFGIMP